jgi:hypothetical protein
MNKKISIMLAVFVLLISTLACGSSSTPTTAPIEATTAPDTSGGSISNIYMSNNADGSGSTNTFAPADTIYVFFDVTGVDNGATFEINWYALNVDGQDASTPFTTTDYTYNGESTLFAQIESTQGGFPVANYRVEIDLNNAKVGEQEFSVQ